MSTYCNYWNKVSLVKSKIKQSKKIDSIGIGLASPEEIRHWGERRLPNGTLIGKVDKDHTVDYESLKPIEGGLFCERIFGPVEDFYCSCDRKGEKNEKFCPNCEVEFTKSRVRRVRMGYIPLAVPVVHVWYLRGRPSYIANLVGKNRNSIDRLAYGETLCESFIGFSSLKSIDKKESFTNICFADPSGLAKLSLASPGKQRLCLTPLLRKPSAKMNLLGGHWGAGYAQGLITSNEPLCIQRKAFDSVGVKAEGSIEKQHDRLLQNVASRVKQTGSISLMPSQKFPIPPAFSVTSQSTSNFLRCSYYNPQTSYASPTGNIFDVSTASLKGLASYSLPRYLCAKLRRGCEALHSFGRKASKEEVRAIIPVLQRMGALKGSLSKGMVARVSKKPKQRSGLILRPIVSLTSSELLYPLGTTLTKKKNSGNKLTPLTKWFFSHTVVASTGSMKNIYRCPRSSSFFTVPMQKAMGKVESIKQTSFTKPVVVSNRNKISFLSRNGFRRYSKKRYMSYVHPLVLFHTQEAALGVPFTGPITELSTTLLFLRTRSKSFPSFVNVRSSEDVSKAKDTQEGSAKQMLVNPKESFTSLLGYSKKRGPFIPSDAKQKAELCTAPYKSFTSPSKFILAEGLHKATTASIINNDSFTLLGMPTESVAVYPERFTKQYPFGVRESIAEKQGFTDPTPLRPPSKFILAEGILRKRSRGVKQRIPNNRPITSNGGFLLALRPKGFEETYKNQIFEQKQKYLKFHTLPLFSTFVYKEWSHRFSFLEYFIWSARNTDLVLPFYAYQNSRPEKSRANLCESIRKSSLNLIKNKFFLRFSNKNTENIWPITTLHPKGSFADFVPKGSPQLRKPFLWTQSTGSHWGARLRKASTSMQINNRFSFLLYSKGHPSEAKLSFGCTNIEDVTRTKFSFLLRTNGVSEARKNAYLNYYNPLTSCASLTKVRTVRPFWAFTGPIPNPSTESLVSKKQLEGFAFLRHPIWGAEGKQSTKMDTQQFPRLTELLNFTGGAALRSLLSRFDLVVLSKFLRHELKNVELKVNNLLALKMLTYSQGLLLGKLAKRRSKQIRRLKLLELFQSQKSNPEWMILSVIPVLPPDLRPILRVNDDFVVASDLNRLYQTVLRRNNTIHERLDDPLPCPESGLFRQRSLQKAVDGLLENGKGGGTPLCASKRRPLVSLSHVLKGKKGLFRQHLLGKRVDYSGRSVIVVGPRLQLHECGLPKEMAIELFQPFLLHRLKVKGIATSNTTARRMIQQGDPVIWHILKQLVYEHPVLLNRAPTLHRLGIQAFQPRLVSGRAILLHPLVCNGFNADFDGDQMAVHVPLSFQARAEAWKIMWSKNNFLSPATGQPILVPSQDMVLGCYYLSVSIPRILNTNVIPLASDLKNLPQRGTQKKEGFTDPLAKRRVFLRTQNEGGIKQSRAFPSTDCFANILCEAAVIPSDTPEGSAKQEGKEFIEKVDRLPVMARGIQDATKKETFGLLHTNNKFPASYLPQKHSLASQCMTDALTPQGIPSEGKESVISITCNRPSQRQSTFLNENKGHYFSNLQDSLLAYFQGRLQTHTPFWVRIDPVSFHPITPLLTNNVQLQRFTKSKFTCGPKPQLCKTLYSRFAYRAMLERAFTRAITSTSASVLQPLYGSSREMCKTLFQNKSANHFQIRVEANETLEAPLELRLSVDGNLANILTMFQNHYNYNATWVKQCKEESIKYMRTTAGRVVINEAVFKDF